MKEKRGPSGLARRALPLALLGAAVALVVIQLRGTWPNNVSLSFEMNQARLEGLARVEVTIFQPPEHRLIIHSMSRVGEESAESWRHHSLQLLDGEYEILVQLYYQNSPSRELTRPLIIAGNTQVVHHLD